MSHHELKGTHQEQLEIAPPEERAPLPEPDVKTDGILQAQLKSRFDDLTIWQSLVAFKRATIICVIVGIAASTDGKSEANIGQCF